MMFRHSPLSPPKGCIMEIRLEPTLSSCIETTARQEYEVILGTLLKTGQEDKALEDRLELLRVFLESADFRRLRSLSEKSLLHGRRVEFLLRSTESALGYEIEMNEDDPNSGGRALTAPSGESRP